MKKAKRTKRAKRKAVTAPILKLSDNQMMALAAMMQIQFVTWKGDKRAIEVLEDTCHGLANCINNDVENTVRHMMLYGFFRGQQ